VLRWEVEIEPEISEIREHIRILPRQTRN
jgi:hypothetical protein